MNNLLMIVVVATAFSTAAQASLVGWWKLDETSGVTIADSSGFGNTGKLENMTGNEWTAGKLGGALEFAGAGDYIRLDTGLSLDVTDGFTFAAWVQLAPDSDGAYYGIGGRLIRLAAEPRFYHGFALVRHTSNVFRLWIGNGSTSIEGTGSLVNSNETYTDTDWHHVAGVRRNGFNYLYVDGVQQADSSVTVFLPSEDFAYIGRQYSHLDDRYFSGLIDDVYYFNHGLSTAEITNGPARPSPPICANAAKKAMWPWYPRGAF